jgi:hypothetical protein
MLFKAAELTASTDGKKDDASNDVSMESEREAYLDAMEVPPSKKRVASPGKRVWWARVASRAAAMAAEVVAALFVRDWWGEEEALEEVSGEEVEGGGEDVGLLIADM